MTHILYLRDLAAAGFAISLDRVTGVEAGGVVGVLRVVATMNAEEAQKMTEDLERGSVRSRR